MATLTNHAGPQTHAVIDHQRWLAARRELLEREKAFTRLRDELNEQRRALPWERIDKRYEFEGPDGRESLADLFAGRSQLLVWHFMFGPEWKQGCSHCSFWADGWNGVLEHLAARDTTLLAVSQASLAQIEAFRQRMGWRFRWLSSAGSDFNFDFQASLRPEERARGKVLYNYREIEPFSDQMHGCSAFYRDGEALYHTYSTYERGVDMLNVAYQFLDLTAKGRDEDWSQPHSSGWVKHRDRY